MLRVEDLQFVAPSVAVNNFGQGIDFNIRGIGKGEHNSQTLTGVITYRDGVPTFPGYITEEPYYDLANVEVLRGPQGTFVGQNATGGAVFVNTNDPVIGGGHDGYVMAGLGNYYDTMLQGAVNIPVSDTFALRIAGFGDNRGSFFAITDTDPADNCPQQKYAGCKPGYNPGDVQWGGGPHQCTVEAHGRAHGFCSNTTRIISTTVRIPPIHSWTASATFPERATQTLIIPTSSTPRPTRRRSAWTGSCGVC